MFVETMFVEKMRMVFGKEKYVLIAVFSATIILFLYSFSTGLIALPVLNVSTIRMVPITVFDIIFMFVFSSIAGISVAVYWYSRSSAKEVCTLSGGIFTGLLTSVCPFCPILLLALLGVSMTLEFLAPYFPFLRVLSLSLLLLSLYWLNKTIKMGKKVKVEVKNKKRLK